RTAGALPPVVIDKPSGTLTLAGTLRTARDWTYAAGTLDPGTSLLVLAGTETLTSPGATLYALEVRGGTATLGTALELLADLTITSGTMDTAGYPVTVGGDLVVAGTLSADGVDIRVGGDVTLSGAYTAGTGTLILDGAAPQLLASGGNALNDFAVANPFGVTLGDDVFVGGILDLASGTLTVGPFVLTLASPIAGTATNLLTDASSSITVVGIASGIRLPASVADLANLTITNPSGVALDAPLTIHGALSLDGGNLIARPYLVSIAPGGGVARVGGHVIGRLQKPVAAGGALALIFEVGDEGGYTPAEVTWASVATDGRLTVAAVSDDHAELAAAGLDPAASVNRHWTLEPDGLSPELVDVAVTYLVTDLDPAADPASLLAAWRDPVAWSLPTVVARSATSLSISALPLGPGALALGMGASDLRLSVTDAPDPAAPGTQVVYRLSVVNDGPMAASRVSVSVELPAGGALASVSSSVGSCTASAATVMCDLGQLVAGATASVELGLTFAAEGTYELRASAAVSGTSDPLIANNTASASTTVVAPPPTVTPSAPARAEPPTADGLPDTAVVTGAALLGLAIVAGVLMLTIAGVARGRRPYAHGSRAARTLATLAPRAGRRRWPHGGAGRARPRRP
ncbi:MAG: hypothetical protein ACRDGV_02760, partial [Candidatus Limnocylindria bacterium]